jgi:hypothetical protein
VLSKLDYGNATLIDLPACQYDRLQSVLNAAARSIAGLRRSDHITDTLASFHWLHAPQRVQFKLAVLTFRALHGLAPDYLSSEHSNPSTIAVSRLWPARCPVNPPENRGRSDIFRCRSSSLEQSA